ncbi:two-component response regulator ARR22-like [Impatiens glandulifera]|uniref:two-component response regulator ARR22-like n=1 Tax=Impatiens glandulifera TaxID=253017 RepID=UPI001FB0D34A|nr:two-component response regulator ARR22-like [Impatiens glandulifera]
MACKMGSSSSKDLMGNGMKGDNAPKLSVLIVDDDAILRRIHTMFFKKHGFETTAVENGQEAINLYRSGSWFHLVLMDKEMPVMDGPEATRELRAMGVNNMIVGMTSRDRDSEQQSFMEAGLDNCYIKPLTANVVVSLAQAIANKNSE